MEAQTEIHKIHSVSAQNQFNLMHRLHQIVSGSPHGPFSKTSGYAWQLDDSNDWHAELTGTTLRVSHRYCQEKADALAKLSGLLFQ